MTEKKRWKVLRFLGSAIPVLLVVYVLSIGPVWASFTPQTPAEAVENFIFVDWFYYPLFWIAEHFSPFDQLLAWYIGLFY